MAEAAILPCTSLPSFKGTDASAQTAAEQGCMFFSKRAVLDVHFKEVCKPAGVRCRSSISRCKP